MHIADFIKLNDWRMKAYLIGSGAVVGLFILFEALEFGGIAVPFGTPLTGALCILLLPGFTILRIFRLHGLSLFQTLAYTIGLSFVYLMLTGIALNFLGPAIGIDGPLTECHIFTANVIGLVVLIVIGYFRDRGYTSTVPSAIKLDTFIHQSELLFLLIPLLGILAILLINRFENNLLLMILLPVIAIVVIITVSTKLIPSRLYPFIIFCIYVALIYQVPLFSNYLYGHDLPLEYYVYKMTEVNQFWDSTAPYTAYNVMLAVTLLPTQLASLLHVEGVWLFKVVYPFFFAFIPVGLYSIFKRYFSEKVSFLGAFFFMSFHFAFFTTPYMMRQSCGAFFLMLLLTLFFDTEMNKNKRTFLILLFSVGLIFSHHAVTMIWVGLVVANWVFKLFKKGEPKFSLVEVIMVLVVIIALGWYLTMSNGIVITQLSSFFRYIYNTSLTHFFDVDLRNPTILKAVGVISASSPAYDVSYWFYRITQGLIVVGFIRILFGPMRKEVSYQFKLLSFLFLTILFLLVVLPYFSKPFAPSRVYYFALFVLAPLSVLGGELIFTWLLKLFRRPRLITLALPALVLLVMVPYYLFQTGLVFEVIKDTPFFLPLSSYRIESSDTYTQAKYYTLESNQSDVISAEWLHDYKNDVDLIWADTSSHTHVLVSYGMMPAQTAATVFHQTRDFFMENPRWGEKAYIYTNYINNTRGIYTTIELTTSGQEFYTYRTEDMATIAGLFNQRNLIYSNGGSKIYYGYGEK